MSFLHCPQCDLDAVEVRVTENRPKARVDPAGRYIRTVCLGCGKFFGYRLVEAERPARRRAGGGEHPSEERLWTNSELDTE